MDQNSRWWSGHQRKLERFLSYDTKRSKWSGAFVAFALSAFVLCFWLFHTLATTYMVMKYGDAAYTHAGQFGDSYGSLTCLFSALAFCGVIYTIFRDHERTQKFRLVEAYQGILSSLEHQIDSAEARKLEGWKVEVLYTKQAQYSHYLEEAIRRNEDMRLSAQDMYSHFSQIPWFSPNQFMEQHDRIRAALSRHNTENDNALFFICRHGSILPTLKRIFVEELKRPSVHPFSLEELAEAGSALYNGENTPAARMALIRELRELDEWRKAHPDLAPDWGFPKWLHTDHLV